jgi:hypothetical protein
MKTTTNTAKQILARPCAVLVAGDAPEPAVLNAYDDDLATAERHRKEWLATTARHPDSPTAATCLRIGDQETDILNAMKQLAAMLTDRKARVHIRMAIQDVQDWRNGRDL